MRPAVGAVVLQLTVPGDPVSKARPRVANGRAYTPARTRDAEDALGWAFRAARAVKNGTDDLAVRLRFRTATHRRVDLDNLVKLVLDAANRIVWADDAQVVAIDAAVERGCRTPGTDITVTIAQPAPQQLRGDLL